MRNKAPLMLIELTVMLLILALAAALCMQGFAWADTQAQNNARKDRALVELQSAAEVLQACSGDLQAAVALHGGVLEQGNWTILLEDGTVLRAVPEQAALPNLGTARLEAEYNGAQLLQLQVCWQEAGYEE